MAVGDKEVDSDLPGAPAEARRTTVALAAAIRRLWGRALAGLTRLLNITIFSNLTRRIVVLNLAALAALVLGILYLNQWRQGLIEARVQSLRIQGEIIAAAIAASATAAAMISPWVIRLSTLASISPCRNWLR